MTYKRILTIQDISCVGQCSATVALPILSACGHETCILPTALLSTHTGGFGRPAVVHLADALESVVRHWQENGILFDAILVGYLGSVEAVRLTSEILDTMLTTDGISIVDPALADHGKIYSGLSEEYAAAMEQLCRKAEIILPNITEAALFSGSPYQDQPDQPYIERLLNKLDHPCVILTGVGFAPDRTGVLISDREGLFHYSHERIGKNCSGTGDMFAACFTGALLRGKSKREAVKIAADFVCSSITLTAEAPAHWYGVKFEPVLPDLMRILKK